MRTFVICLVIHSLCIIGSLLLVWLHHREKHYAKAVFWIVMAGINVAMIFVDLIEIQYYVRLYE